jgi:hypothetical protein
MYLEKSGNPGPERLSWRVIFLLMNKTREISAKNFFENG